MVCARVLAAAMLLGAIGCGTEVKNVLIDQGIGFLSAISAAATSSLIQQFFGT
jgi:hypothetical protein